MILRTMVDVDGKIYEIPVVNTQFFFDTADGAYIEAVWEKLMGIVHPLSVIGITTNPNALHKIGCESLADLTAVIPKLCRLVTRIRQGLHGGIVYVQMPSSVMAPEHVLAWGRRITSLGDGLTSVGIKIPHFTYALELAQELDEYGLHVNVTGISDWGTILKAFSYPGVTFASLIPGRMDEKGIDANAQMDFIARVPRLSHQDIIAGSMRTIEGLRNAITRNTIPTIGTRVWDQLMETDLREFPKMWAGSLIGSPAAYDHAPLITDVNRQLSVDFFQQMDLLGQQMFIEFVQERTNAIQEF